MDINEAVRLERDDPDHAVLFVRGLLFICILVFILGSTAIMANWIVTTSPPEPQWWTEFEKLIGVN